MCKGLTRRDWLAISGLAAGAMALAKADARPVAARNDETARTVPAAPAQPVSVAKVRSYERTSPRNSERCSTRSAASAARSGKNGRHQGEPDWRQPVRGIRTPETRIGCIRCGRIGSCRVGASAQNASAYWKARAADADTSWKTSCCRADGTWARSRNAAPLVEFEDTDGPAMASNISLLPVKTKAVYFPGIPVESFL